MEEDYAQMDKMVGLAMSVDRYVCKDVDSLTAMNWTEKDVDFKQHVRVFTSVSNKIECGRYEPCT